MVEYPSLIQKVGKQLIGKRNCSSSMPHGAVVSFSSFKFCPDKLHSSEADAFIALLDLFLLG